MVKFMKETVLNIIGNIREIANDLILDFDRTEAEEKEGKYLLSLANRLEKAYQREIEDLMDAVKTLRDGACLHCDMKEACSEGEDGMSTTCNAVANLNAFINTHSKVEVCNDDYPF